MPENGLSYLILKIVVTTDLTGPADRHCFRLESPCQIPPALSENGQNVNRSCGSMKSWVQNTIQAHPP